MEIVISEEQEGNRNKVKSEAWKFFVKVLIQVANICNTSFA